ncbi:hypothetical protein AUJ14_01870 [Candidatus Micrarchaeota archaeon CG1_02_55_22]|nr:MAG: hypothetical protein AUJ14_01870 [Candidatus Micrarchaeota archaeon CG1_02_55_22]
MGILDLFGKKTVSLATPYTLTCETHPYSLQANTNDYVDLEVNLQNHGDVDELTAVVITVPKGLGFERSAIQQQREVRLGYLKPGEKKFFKVTLWGTQRTNAGSYPIKIHAMAHYKDYAHVLKEVSKTITFRVG